MIANPILKEGRHVLI